MKHHPPIKYRQPSRVVFQPEVYIAMQRGINWIADAVRPTLGPFPRFVAIDPVSRGNVSPLLLDNGAQIARRILELPNVNEDVGAMFCRKVLWDQYEQVGDGTAMTAVLLQSVFNQGIKYLAAGGNAMMLRRYLEHGLCIIREQLESRVVPIDCQMQIVALANSVSHDEVVAEALGAIFDVIGEYGLLELRSDYGREVSHEFVEGVYFKTGLHSKQLLTRGETLEVQLEDVALLISDFEIEDARQLVATVGEVYSSSIKALVIVAKSLSEQSVSVLAAMSRDPKRFHVIAVKSPDDLNSQTELLEDLALLTGARLFLTAIGDRLSSVRVSDLGFARRAWADMEFFGIVGAKGSSQKRRAHIEQLITAIDKVDKPETRSKLRERIGTLLGGSATLRIGGLTESQIKTRKASTEQTILVLRNALRKGILPGSGVALLVCRAAIHAMATRSRELDEQVAYKILCRALEEPIRTILANAGYEPNLVLAELTQSEFGCGFDAHTGKIVNVMEAGIFDSADVILGAVTRAISSAALALTIDVFVHHKNPVVSISP